MGKHTFISLIVATSVLAAASASATVIEEFLEVPSGGVLSGKFLITPSGTTWAFGVGNDAIQDTSISGISSINTLRARDHWITALI